MVLAEGRNKSTPVFTVLSSSVKTVTCSKNVGASIAYNRRSKHKKKGEEGWEMVVP